MCAVSKRMYQQVCHKVSGYILTGVIYSVNLWLKGGTGPAKGQRTRAEPLRVSGDGLRHHLDGHLPHQSVLSVPQHCYKGPQRLILHSMQLAKISILPDLVLHCPCCVPAQRCNGYCCCAAMVVPFHILS